MPNQISATQKLINRFMNYNRSVLYFNHEDVGLVSLALAENPLSTGEPHDSVVFLSYLASESVTTSQQYVNFRNFVYDYANFVIEFNFAECSDNEWWSGMSDEELTELEQMFS